MRRAGGRGQPHGKVQRSKKRRRRILALLISDRRCLKTSRKLGRGQWETPLDYNAIGRKKLKKKARRLKRRESKSPPSPGEKLPMLSGPAAWAKRRGGTRKNAKVLGEHQQERKLLIINGIRPIFLDRIDRGGGNYTETHQEGRGKFLSS